MENQFSRTERLLGADGIEKLRRARVLVFGAGGVGGYVIESLARSGIGTIGVCDGDSVSVTNLNRQILATHDTLGHLKTAAAQARVAAINPLARFLPFPFYYDAETKNEIPLSDFDFICDAIDRISAKVELISAAKAAGIPIISSMGTGNKLDPSKFCVADISETRQCPLAKIMRANLRKIGIESLPVVFSPEPPAVKLSPPASVPFVPPVAGFIMAGYVINKLAKL